MVDGDIVLCGGRDGGKTTGSERTICRKLVDTGEGLSWTHYATLAHPRSEHTSWVSPRGLLLFGSSGYESVTDSVELVIPAATGQVLFQDSRITMFMCSIQFENFVFLTGGVRQGELVGLQNVYEFKFEVCLFWFSN